MVDKNTGRIFGKTASLSACNASMCCPSSVARWYQKCFSGGASYRDRQDGQDGSDWNRLKSATPVTQDTVA